MRKTKSSEIFIDDIDVGNQENFFDDDFKNHLHLNILNTTDQYQEIEIVYGNKKKVKRITKFLPKFISSALAPSLRIGPINSSNLSRGLEKSGVVLHEKFLRILAKINRVSEIKTAEKIWDSEERITSSEKTILVAVINRLRPESERLNRLNVSLRSNEISDQNSFKNFIAEVLDLTKNSQKLIPILFGNLTEKLSEEKQSSLINSLSQIIAETDESKRSNQMKFLQKIIGETGNEKNNLRSSF
jgi:hypothetical protein